MKVRQGSLHVLQVVGDVGAAVEVLVERSPQDFLSGEQTNHVREAASQL